MDCKAVLLTLLILLLPISLFQEFNPPFKEFKERQGQEMFAICFFGKTGNMVAKSMFPTLESSNTTLILSAPNHIEKLILPNSDKGDFHIFAHSWMKNYPHIVEDIHTLYSPYIKAEKHDELKRNLLPVHSMMISMWQSLKLMMDYSATHSTTYRLVVLMRFDTWFKAPVDLFRIDPSIIWVPVCCQVIPGGFKKNNRENPKNHITLDSGLMSLFTYMNKDYDKFFIRGTRDEILFSSPSNLFNFFSSLLQSFLFIHDTREVAVMGHYFIGRHAINLNLPQTGKMKELEGFVFTFHYIVTRYYKYTPFLDGVPADLSKVRNCDGKKYDFYWVK